jgi:hypothetical protein
MLRAEVEEFCRTRPPSSNHGTYIPMLEVGFTYDRDLQKGEYLEGYYKLCASLAPPDVRNFAFISYAVTTACRVAIDREEHKRDGILEP